MVRNEVDVVVFAFDVHKRTNLLSAQPDLTAIALLNLLDSSQILQ